MRVIVWLCETMEKNIYGEKTKLNSMDTDSFISKQEKFMQTLKKMLKQDLNFRKTITYMKNKKNVIQLMQEKLC